MAFAKRIVLFFAVNLLILITISVVLSVLGIGSYITPGGIDYGTLAVFCMVWGFGGAFISLGLSRIMAKWMMGVQVIDPNTRDATERWLLETVHRLAKQAGVPAPPQVGYYEGADMNAFATGPTQRRSLVAVSSGLIDHMSRQHVEGVLAHEVTVMDHSEGLAANVVSAILVGTGAVYGLPMSTTHVSSGGIIGIGSRRGALQMSTVRLILWAWVVTVPVSAALAAAGYGVVCLLMGGGL